jgi:hypothetical protein
MLNNDMIYVKTVQIYVTFAHVHVWHGASYSFYIGIRVFSAAESDLETYFSWASLLEI